MFFLLQRHSDGRNWVEWAAGGRPFQAQKEVEMSKQKITAQIIIQTKFVRYEFGGGGGMKKRRCWRRRHFWKIGQGEEKNWRRKCRAIFVVDVVVPFWRKNFRAISPFVTLSTWRQRRRYLLSERQHHLIKRGSYLPAPVSILLATIKRNLLWAAKNGNKRREKPATVWCILLLNRKGGNSACLKL